MELNLILEYLKIKKKILLRSNRYDVFIISILLIALLILTENLFAFLLLIVVYNLYQLSNKNDKKILIHHFKKSEVLVLYLTETLIVNSPVIFVSIFKNSTVLFTFFSFFIPLIIYLTHLIFFENLRIQTVKLKFINGYYFELNSFFRRKTYFLVLIVLCYILIGTDAFFFFLLSLFIMELFNQTYSINEQKEFLQIFFLSNSLKIKIIKNLLLSLILFLPGLLIGLKYKEYFNGFLFISLITTIYNIAVITKKYAEYDDAVMKNYISLPQFLRYYFLSITILGGLIQIVANYKKSERKIETYVNH